MNLKAMPLDELRQRFTAAGEDLNRIGAALIISDVGEGSLLLLPSIRECLRQDGEKFRMYWADLAKLARENTAADLMRLSSTTRLGLELACALATGAPIEDLGTKLCRLGTYNARVVLEALAIPLHVDLTGKG